MVEEIDKIKEYLEKIKNFWEIDKKKEKLSSLQQKTANSEFWKKQNPESIDILKEIKEIQETIAKFDSLNDRARQLEEMFLLAQQDSDWEKEFNKELTEFKKELEQIIFQFKLSSPNDKANAIICIHAGAGGTEACDWAEMLFRMYKRWAERKNFEIEITDILPGEEVGIKNITFIIKGPYAYGYLKGETGVHRLVRISPFDANKRRHTSFASVDVIPQIEEDIEIKINESDIKIETYRSSGPGGQHVNKTDSAVRITHLPTGIVVQCQIERSQYKNKKTALQILKARLYQLEEEKRKDEKERLHNEKGEIGWGYQIRSYVFCPYTLVKDHRTNKETGNVKAVMDGDIDLFIQA